MWAILVVKRMGTCKNRHILFAVSWIWRNFVAYQDSITR